jgi:hypothetical protein
MKVIKHLIIHLLIVFTVSLVSCDNKDDYKSYTDTGLFRLIDIKRINRDLINKLDYKWKYNPYFYRKLSNGAGVALSQSSRDIMINPSTIERILVLDYQNNEREVQLNKTGF